MRMRLKLLSSVIAVGILLSTIVSDIAQARKTRHRTYPIVVSILPQKYFVDRIGGKYVDVEVLVSPGQSPATYNPLPNQIRRILNADAWFTASVPFEKRFLTTARNYTDKMEIVPSQARVEMLPMESTVATIDGEPYDDSHGHAEGEPDPHFWLDPMRAGIMAENILVQLNTIAPAHSEDFEANYRGLVAELDSIDNMLRERFSDDAGAMFLTFHPSLGYFAHAYGLKQYAIEESGKQASARQVSEIVKFAKEKGMKHILVQEQFPFAQAETIASEIGGEVILIDPLAEDYIENLMEIAAAVEKALVR